MTCLPVPPALLLDYRLFRLAFLDLYFFDVANVLATELPELYPWQYPILIVAVLFVLDYTFQRLHRQSDITLAFEPRLVFDGTTERRDPLLLLF